MTTPLHTAIRNALTPTHPLYAAVRGLENKTYGTTHELRSLLDPTVRPHDLLKHFYATHADGNSIMCWPAWQPSDRADETVIELNKYHPLHYARELPPTLYRDLRAHLLGLPTPAPSATSTGWSFRTQRLDQIDLPRIYREIAKTNLEIAEITLPDRPPIVLVRSDVAATIKLFPSSASAPIIPSGEYVLANYRFACLHTAGKIRRAYDHARKRGVKKPRPAPTPQTLYTTTVKGY